MQASEDNGAANGSVGQGYLATKQDNRGKLWLRLAWVSSWPISLAVR
jgi:hypothetical protein